MLETPKIQVNDESWFIALVKASFTQRRKTLANNLKFTYGFDKETTVRALMEVGAKENSRAESLDIYQFAKLSQLLKKPVRIN